MATIITNLNFNGNTEEAFNFYKSVFGGEFTAVQRFKDTPHADKIPADEMEKIMHVALPIGGNILMGTDITNSTPRVVFGTNSPISIDADSKEESDKLYYGLSAGGKIGMPLEKMFWGAYFGFFTDKVGVQWMVSFNENQH